MKRECINIHPYPVPGECPICAAYVHAVGAGPGRSKYRGGPFSVDKLFGDTEGGTTTAGPKECPPGNKVNESTFLEEPEQINVCESGSGSGGSGPVCEMTGGGGCGVVGVYCQGNQLMVMYRTYFQYLDSTTTTTSTTTYSPWL